MLSEHPQFPCPPDAARIWRYMDLAKFVSLLDRNALFFVRCSKLLDTHEGLYIPRGSLPLTDEYKQRFREHRDKQKPQMCVNCWHVAAEESAAMWDLYGTRQAGIAICSTYGRLKSVLSAAPRKITTGLVRYHNDVERASLYYTDGYAAYLQKRLSFAHESELRALFLAPKSDWLPGQESDYGYNIPVDVNTLIDEVYVAPQAEPWFARTVESIRTKFGFAMRVRQSDLYSDPLA